MPPKSVSMVGITWSSVTPVAIHVTPEALHGGAIGLLADGDLLRVDAVNGRLDCLTDLSGRTQAEIDLTPEQEGGGVNCSA